MAGTTQDQDKLAQQIGTAWALITNQRAAEAVAAFGAILVDHPTLLDGLYGMGLAQALNGHYTEAIQAYEHCQKEAVRELELHPGADRYLMLNRMCTQRVRDLRLISAPR